MTKIDTQSCVVTGKKDVSVVEQQIDYQGQGTLVKVTRGGICGSDLHYYEHGQVGDFKVREAMVLGHEVVGVVEKSDTDRLKPGQKVALNPSKPCKACKYCLSGDENQCTTMKFFGSAMYFPHINGAFTQYKIVDSDQCIAFDNQVSDRLMVFAEPLAVAIHAVNQAGDIKGKTVFVSGVGPIGSLIVAAAKAKGAKEIVCADLSERCLSLAQEMGATIALDAAKGDFAPYQADKGYFDVSFDASGHPSSIRRCLELTRARGTLVQVGMGGAVNDFPLMMLIAKEINWVGSFRFTEEFNTAVEWLANKTVDPMPLLSAEFPQGDLVEALEFAMDKSKASKVQLVF
jgi:L-idonate 5-dehydrogenase